MLGIAYLFAIVAPLVLLAIALATNRGEQNREGVVLGHTERHPRSTPSFAVSLPSVSLPRPSLHRLRREPSHAEAFAATLPVHAPAAPVEATAPLATPAVSRMARPVLPTVASTQPKAVVAAAAPQDYAPTFAASTQRAQILTVAAQSRH